MSNTFNRPLKRDNRGRGRLPAKAASSLDQRASELASELGVSQEPCADLPQAEMAYPDQAAFAHVMVGLAVIGVITAVNWPILL